MSLDHDARYWGVLNRLRERALGAYDVDLARPRGDMPSVAIRVLVAALLLLGSGWIACALLYGGHVELGPDHVPAPLWGELLGRSVMALPGVAIVWITGSAARSGRRAVRARASFDRRKGRRARWQVALEELRERWQGHVSTSGVGAASRFLIEHHPDQALFVLTTHMRAGEERRLSLVGAVEGAPVLVEIVDFAVAGPHMTPPSLVVLVAQPMTLRGTEERLAMGPFRSAPSPTRIEDTPPHAELVAEGRRRVVDGGRVGGSPWPGRRVARRGVDREGRPSPPRARAELAGRKDRRPLRAGRDPRPGRRPLPVGARRLPRRAPRPRRARRHRLRAPGPLRPAARADGRRAPAIDRGRRREPRDVARP